MTIDEAIEINTKELAPLLVGKKIEWQGAFWLGIEALKAWKEHRGTGSLMDPLLLPGETKD